MDAPKKPRAPRRSGHVLVCFHLVIAGALGAQESGQVPPSPTDPDTDAWRHDIQFLASALKARHADFDHTLSEARFDLEIEELLQRLGLLAEHEIVVELARITAMIGDGHTGIPLVSSSIGFHAAPFRFRIYPDGVFLTATRPEHRGLVGGRLVRVAGFSVEEVLARVLPLVFGDSHWNRARHPLLEIYLATAEVLHAVGVTASSDVIPYTIITPEGDVRTVTLPARPLDEVGDVALIFRQPDAYEDVVAERDQGPTGPLWLRRQSETYWFESIPESSAVYIQVNEMSNFSDEPLARVFERALDAAEQEEVERFVIDLRLNDGGDHIHLPIVHEIIARRGINRAGRLFVLIGPGTFSAAETFAVDLETHTNAVFIGEPTGGRPNHFGSGGALFLPNSGLRVRFSRTFFQNGEPDDDRQYLAPHVYAPMTHVAESTGRDPALEAAVAWTARPRLADVLEDAHREQGTEGVRAALTEHVAEPENAFVPLAPGVTTLGYRLLRQDRRDEAIEIFRMAVEIGPRSVGAWEGLGRALEDEGRADEALGAYRRTLRIDPGNRTAGDALNRLQPKDGDGSFRH